MAVNEFDPAQKKRLRLLTYNVHSCIGWDGECNPSRIATVLQHAAPDIVCLQEVQQRHGQINTNQEQLAVLKTSLGMHTSFFESHTIPPMTAFGNAVCSAMPMQCLKHVSLPRYKSGEPRTLVWLRCIWQEHPLDIIACHLSFRRLERERQIAFINSEHVLASTLLAKRFVLLGDMNTRKARFLNAIPAHQHLNRRPFLTWHARFPCRAIDTMYISEGLTIESANTVRSPLTRLASDHLPFFADIRAL